MSLTSIRAALETAVANMSPALVTAWENRDFVAPAANIPYQRVFMLLAKPDNSEWGPSHTERGILQINLLYPRFSGTRDSASRCELLRGVFRRGSSFTYSGVTVTITDTPEVSMGVVDNDRFNTPVKIRFSAYIP